MKKNLYIYGNVVKEDGVSYGLITIRDGIIAGFKRGKSPPLSKNVHAYDANYLIFPGFIDIHTHCREDTTEIDNYKEDFYTAGLAALSGGVTYIADMPNNPQPPVDFESYMKKYALSKRCPIDVLLYAGIGQNTNRVRSHESFEGLGVPYKVFLGPSTRSNDVLHFDDYKQLNKVLEQYVGESVSFHCEDPVLLDLYKNGKNHEQRRPAVCEYTAIDVAINFIKSHKLKGKICHVSTRQGLEKIIKAKREGVDITCEITPHHLYFDIEAMTAKIHHFLQVNPPIRHRADREFLLQELKAGNIDYLASDHAPHTVKEKLKSVSGIPQLDTYGPFVAWLIKKCEVDPTIIYKMACKNPGNWIEQFTGRKVGQIEVGYEASITVIDMDKTAFDGRPLYTKCNWSPFDLRKLPGLVQTVFLKGEKVVDGLYIAESAKKRVKIKI